MTQQVQTDAIPDALKERKQWVTWRYHTRKGDDKPTKVPFNARTGDFASSKNADDWSDYHTALRAYQHSSTRFGQAYDGIGFVFSDDDNFVGVDLDDCLTNGTIAPWAKTIIEQLPSYAEISPSGTGVKIFVEGSIPNSVKLDDYYSGGIEMYNSGRYFTVTGQRFGAAPSAVQFVNGALTRLHDEVSQEKERRRRKRYLDRALDDELKLLKSKKEGGRNNQLYDSTRALMRFVQSDDISEQDARDWLLDAATGCGLSVHEARQCIDSAFRGTVNPFQMPAAQEPVNTRKAKQDAPAEPRKRKLIHGDEMSGLFPPTEWIIPNVIPKGKLIENFGMGGSGKSLINLDIALTVSNFANVIYIAAEDETEYLERKEAWHAFHKKPAPGFYFWGEPVNLMQPDEVEAFLNEACAVDPVLIVLDPLASCMPGYNDSETGAMSVAIDSLNRIRKATGATVLICHHTGWSDTHERGSSALRWACRMVMKTTNHDEYVSLSCEKVNGMKKFDKRYFKMVETDTAPVMLPFDKITERGTQVTTKHVEVLETLSKSIFRDGATFTQIFDDLQQAKSTLNNSISRLIDLGAIVKQGSGRGGVTYLITERGTSILDRHNMGKNPSFTQAPVDSARGFNWVVQCGTEQNTELQTELTTNNDRTNYEQTASYRELDGYSSSVDIPHSSAAVQSSSVCSSVFVHSDCSSSFGPASLEAGDDEQRTEQTDEPQQQPSWDKLDWPYVTRQYAAGNTAAIKTHCSMRRISFDDVMAELQGIVLPDDFENETL